MEELGTGSAALDSLIDVIVEEVVFEEDLRELLDQLESKLGA